MEGFALILLDVIKKNFFIWFCNKTITESYSLPFHEQLWEKQSIFKWFLKNSHILKKN